MEKSTLQLPLQGMRITEGMITVSQIHGGGVCAVLVMYHEVLEFSY